MDKENDNTLFIIIIVIVIIIFVFYLVNYFNIKKTNNNYEILQKLKPNKSEVIDLTRNKLPTILLGVIEDWYIYDEKDQIDHNKLTEEVLNENTEILNNTLTLNKNYDISTTISDTNLIQQNKVRHFLCLLSGNISVFLFNPEQKIEYFINDNKQKESKYSFWNEEKDKLSHTKYLEINLGSEQILFVPYGWWYCYKVKENGTILNITSDTFFTAPLSILL